MDLGFTLLVLRWLGFADEGAFVRAYGLGVEEALEGGRGALGLLAHTLEGRGGAGPEEVRLLVGEAWRARAVRLCEALPESARAVAEAPERALDGCPWPEEPRQKLLVALEAASQLLGDEALGRGAPVRDGRDPVHEVAPTLLSVLLCVTNEQRRLTAKRVLDPVFTRDRHRAIPVQSDQLRQVLNEQRAVSVVTELLDRLPNPDGGLRRRFTAGLLFSMITVAGIYWVPGIPTLASTISDAASSANLDWKHLNSTGAIVIVFGVVFLVGNIIDIIAYVFLNRLFSFFGGTMAYQGIQVYFRHVFSGIQDAPSLADTEKATFEKLPAFVQGGLRDPYHRQFEVAFRYLLHVAPDDEKPWLQQLDSRNKNLFSVISSAFLAMMLLAILFFGVGFAGTPALGHGLSQSEKICYTDLVTEFWELTILESDQAFQLYSTIGLGDSGVISMIERILQSEDYKNRMKKIPEQRAMDDSYDPAIVFGNCANADTDDQDSSRARWMFFVVALIIFVLVLSSLAITYALMLRNSIISALEMLQLRQVIELGDALTEGPPTPQDPS